MGDPSIKILIVPKKSAVNTMKVNTFGSKIENKEK